MRYAVLAGFLALLLPASAQAHHFTIDLKVEQDKAQAAAATQTTALGEKPRPRPLLRVKKGDALAVRWVLASTDAKKTYKNVRVHFVAVRENRPGQPEMPRLDKGVVAEHALLTDFRPNDSAKGALTFTIDTPGYYLVRLETIGAAEDAEGHEHFAALDLLVE